MCRLAPEGTLELDSFNLPPHAPPKGKSISGFGGQCLTFGKGGQAYRCAAAADRTGHAILHTLYAKALKFDCLFSVEYFAIEQWLIEMYSAEARKESHGAHAPENFRHWMKHTLSYLDKPFVEDTGCPDVTP